MPKLILSFPDTLTLDDLTEQILTALRNTTTYEDKKKAIQSILITTSNVQVKVKGDLL